jgi:Zn-dependent membrane protease YugP
MTPSILFISLLFLGVSMLVSGILKSKFSKYNQIPLSVNLTGRQVAEKMLRDSGIYDVKIVSVNGFMSDHFNPFTKTVNLSPEVYNNVSISAAAVAAHECGHAVQHAMTYPWLNLRSRLVPVVQFSSGIVQWVLLAGILLINTFPALLLGGIILFGLTTLFSVITLPVELDASRRALVWLKNSGITTINEYPMAKDALKWAALTYVVAALASIATLVQYIFVFLGNNRNRQ